MLFTEKLLALERVKGNYIGEAKDSLQEEYKENKTQTKYGSEGGGRNRNTRGDKREDTSRRTQTEN